MIDIEATIRAHLAGLTALTAVYNGRIYAARSLPAGYKPELGPALLFSIRGGGQEYHSQLFMPSIQFRAFAANEKAAREADRALHDAINDTQARAIAYMRMEDGTLPILLDDPDTGWPYILSFYRFHIQNL